MGYTHYWTHSRRFTNAEFANIITDIQAILFVAKEQGIALGDACGENELAPVEMVVQEFDSGREILFNGLGGEAHETFNIYQNRRPREEHQTASQHGWDFCKTARKPYDVAVTACLCYLESVYPEKFSAESDGTPDEWQAGLQLARLALPRLGNVLQVPRGIVFDDLFDRFLYSGGKLTLATLSGDSALCIIDTKAMRILGQFEGGDATQWAMEWAERVATRRRSKLPERCDVLERWDTRKMRELLHTAQVFGYLKTPPANATT